jgi:hypothetical protein
MRKIDKFIDELQELKKKGYDAKKVDALTEGVNLIAAEYRRRKAKEDAKQKAMVEAAGFAQLDKQCKASGLSKKAFIEGVGRTIIECNQPEDIKTRMMESLEKYVKYLTEAATVAGCLFSMEYLNEESKAMLANNDITGLLHKCVLPNVAHQYGDAATAKRAAIDEISTNPVSHIGLHTYKVDRKLIDTDHEKLFILSDTTDGDPQYPATAPLLLYYADTPKAVDNTEAAKPIQSSSAYESQSACSGATLTEGVFDKLKENDYAYFHPKAKEMLIKTMARKISELTVQDINNTAHTSFEDVKISTRVQTNARDIFTNALDGMITIKPSKDLPAESVSFTIKVVDGTDEDTGKRCALLEKQYQFHGQQVQSLPPIALSASDGVDKLAAHAVKFVNKLCFRAEELILH